MPLRPKFLLAAMLAVVALVVPAGCGSGGSGGTQTGPLSAAEQAYIHNTQQHARAIQKIDPLMTAVILKAKMQTPQGGLPTSMMNATQNQLRKRRNLIRVWDKTGCPTERTSRLCKLWRDQLNLQFRWDDRLIEFINRPYSKASFSALLDAGRRETQQWRRVKAEIARLERAART